MLQGLVNLIQNLVTGVSILVKFFVGVVDSFGKMVEWISYSLSFVTYTENIMFFAPIYGVLIAVVSVLVIIRVLELI